MRRSWPLLLIGFLAACDYGARYVGVTPPTVSNVELGQDVPDDHFAVQPPLIIQCADFFHQNRPGGSDYKGPPTSLCPRAY
jgi:hypothetical protein